jgi:uncharacterized protein involved in type VI secretion and phage assembly
MSLHALLASPEAAPRIHGVVVGIVTNTDDPDDLGRVRVRFPWLSDNDESNWARIAAPFAGDGRGVYFLPDVEDEVLVVFEHGDPRFPYVIGALWNGKDKPPAQGAGKNQVRVIKTRSGHIVRFTDSDDTQTIEIVDSGGGSIVFDGKQNSIKVSAQQITIEASGALKLKGATIDLN